MKNNIKKLLIIGCIASTISTSQIALVYAQPLPSDLTMSTEPRNGNCRWAFKTVNGKKYKRLFNCETKEWVTDWILVK